jgi:hypothetical protein
VQRTANHSQPPLAPSEGRDSTDIRQKLARYRKEREEMENMRNKMRNKNSERAASMQSLKSGNSDNGSQIALSQQNPAQRMQSPSPHEKQQQITPNAN